MPVSHGLIVGVKAINLAFKFSDEYDLLIIWSIFVLVVLAALVLFIKLTKSKKYQEHFPQGFYESSDELMPKKIDYKSAFRIVR